MITCDGVHQFVSTEAFDIDPAEPRGGVVYGRIEDDVRLDQHGSPSIRYHWYVAIAPKPKLTLWLVGVS